MYPKFIVQGELHMCVLCIQKIKETSAIYSSRNDTICKVETDKIFQNNSEFRVVRK